MSFVEVLFIECNGCIGTVLERKSATVPDGWTRLEHYGVGEGSPKHWCPKCRELAEKALREARIASENERIAKAKEST